MLWLALYFPDLGLEVFSATAEPTRSLVLVENNRVVLRNAAAARAGIAPGSTLATACSIVPNLDHCHRSAEKERQRLQFLAEVLYRFTPQVCLHPPCSLVLEISGSLNLFGDAEALQQQVQTLCASLGHQTLLQRAKTPSAALTLARSGQNDLNAAPLESTELSTVMVERFANMGIHTLGPLLALPETELARRFGPELPDFLHRLTGRLPDPQESISPSATFTDSLHLLEAVSDKDALLFPMRRLLGELQTWLIGRQLGAERIIWQFRSHIPNGESCTEEHTAIVPISFGQAQQRREVFLDTTRLKLERVELPQEVLTLTLTAEQLTPWCAGSRELFQPLPGQSGTSASELVDQLRARLGDDACHGIGMVDQHAPEGAWRRSAPGMGNTGIGMAASSSRPLWLFDPPCKIGLEELTLLRGPERIQTDWWQQSIRQGTHSDIRHGICRDYYVARHGSGAECWVFMDEQQQWYLHGYFA